MDALCDDARRAENALADAGANHRRDPECDPEYTPQVTIAFACVPDVLHDLRIAELIAPELLASWTRVFSIS